MNNLKLCPFCGGVAKLNAPGYKYYSPYWCKCTQCGAEGPTESSELEAETGWNKRIQDTVENAPINELQNAYGYLQKQFFETQDKLLKEQAIGHWIFLTNCSNSGVYCSECNTKVFESYPFKKKLSYFCPHCGTRMEGEIERR